MIQIKECYLHILDYINDTKVFSEMPMVLDADIEEYVSKHIESFFEGYDVSDMKLNNSMKVHQMIMESQSSGFASLGLNVADVFLEEMSKSEDIKPCDLICALIEREDKEYMAFIKLNFKTSYVHLVEMEGHVIANKIIRHVSTLPHKTQTVDEGFVVDWMSGKAFIKDKIVTVDGKKRAYIANAFFANTTVLTPKKAVDIMTKTAEKIVQKYQDNNIVSLAKVRSTIHDLIDSDVEMTSESIAEQCFETAAEREAYSEEISKKGLDDRSWTVDEAHKKKIKRSQKIKTASGVEIVLPYDYTANGENLEIINHPDGTLSIQLKNLGELL